MEGDTTIELWKDGDAVATASQVVSGKSYCFEAVTPGTYTMVVSKYGHVSREYEVTVADAEVTLNVKICLNGDVTGDGQVNIGDVGRVYAYVKGTKDITDDYMMACANANGGSLNIGDVGAVYAHVKGTRLLFTENV
jgi:hypothetical protein